MQKEVAVLAGVSRKRPHRSARYWLIVGRDGACKTLTLHSRPRGEILPVFGSEEEADTFLTMLGAFGGGFMARPIAAEDLKTLLWGPLSTVGTVALDPTPGMDAAAVLDLISMDRESFAKYLTDERVIAGARGPAKGPSSSACAWLLLLVLAVLGLILATPTTAHAQDEQDEPATEVGTPTTRCQNTVGDS